MGKPEDAKSGARGQTTFPYDGPLRILTLQVVHRIDRVLASLGPSGEVRLVKNRGKLRFIQRVELEKAILPPSDDDGRPAKR